MTQPATYIGAGWWRVFDVTKHGLRLQIEEHREGDWWVVRMPSGHFLGWACWCASREDADAMVEGIFERRKQGMNIEDALWRYAQ